MNEKLDFHQLYQDHVKMVYNLCLNYLQITQLPTDNFKFKVPTLRNIEFSYPYMHDGRFNSLREVLDHYSSHNFPPENLSKKLVNGIML